MRGFLSGFLMSLLLLALGVIIPAQAEADEPITQVCPSEGVEARSPDFAGRGVMITQFDSSAMWVYEVGNDRRYPLPDTNVCMAHCRVSPDHRWITYFNDATNAFNRMTLLGTQRTLIADYASDVEWWSNDTFLIWTPARSAYLRSITDLNGEREILGAPGVVAIQPGGRYALLIEPRGDTFTRTLVNLAAPNERLLLGEDRTYFNAHGWSPDGEWLAYVEPVRVDGRIGSELYGVAPGSDEPVQWTHLGDSIGAARINGAIVSHMAWSPDSEQIAFWVIPLDGDDPLADTGEAMLHVLNIETGEVSAYCGYTTANHTPAPPHLVWSPDSRYVAFGGEIVGSQQGYTLIALDTETGIFSRLSEGIFPMFGAPDVVAWGLPPG